MKVVALGRYPVKSVRGEELPELAFGPRGARHDRWWALRTPEGRFGSGKTTRRFVRLPRLPEMSARMVGDEAELTLPDGRAFPVSDPGLAALVSEVVGRPVEIAPEGAVRHHDEHPVHVVTTASLRWLGVDWRTVRANVVVDAPGADRVEDAWAGRRFTAGDAEFEVVGPATRCVMVGAAALKALAGHDLTFGVYAKVLRPGVVGLSSPWG
ncbi:MOSC N-terminal beta barrel domain-containing protein [Actinosynnema sp. NPDC020468]|uniref:MOSC domain-containing protein n=1 Tax=Actinosynnema sp. NPDC020468 TaxID=3154488 RepID=UPI0033FAA2ED